MPSRQRISRFFTLLEVMVAAGVLALAVLLAVSIVGGARARILRAERRWGRQHLVNQAAELYLLGGPNAALPPELLPEGFRADCTLTRAEENLHEAALEPLDGWVLGQFHVRVHDRSGTMLGECRVRKVVREDDCN